MELLQSVREQLRSKTLESDPKQLLQIADIIRALDVLESFFGDNTPRNEKEFLISKIATELDSVEMYLKWHEETQDIIYHDVAREVLNHVEILSNILHQKHGNVEEIKRVAVKFTDLKKRAGL